MSVLIYFYSFEIEPAILTTFSEISFFMTFWEFLMLSKSEQFFESTGKDISFDSPFLSGSSAYCLGRGLTSSYSSIFFLDLRISVRLLESSVFSALILFNFYWRVTSEILVVIYFVPNLTAELEELKT